MDSTTSEWLQEALLILGSVASSPACETSEVPGITVGVAGMVSWCYWECVCAPGTTENIELVVAPRTQRSSMYTS